MFVFSPVVTGLWVVSTDKSITSIKINTQAWLCSSAPGTYISCSLHVCWFQHSQDIYMVITLLLACKDKMSILQKMYWKLNRYVCCLFCALRSVYCSCPEIWTVCSVQWHLSTAVALNFGLSILYRDVCLLQLPWVLDCLFCTVTSVYCSCPEFWIVYSV